MSTEISPSSPPASPRGSAATASSPPTVAAHAVGRDEAALLLGVPVATLRTWRSRRRGYGPRAVQVGDSIRYRPADMLAWIDDHTENPDGNVQLGIEASKRGKTTSADLPPLTRRRRPARTTRSGGSGTP